MFTEVGAYAFVVMFGAFVLISQRWMYQSLIYTAACFFVFYVGGAADWIFPLFALLFAIAWGWMAGITLGAVRS